MTLPKPIEKEKDLLLLKGVSFDELKENFKN